MHIILDADARIVRAEQEIDYPGLVAEGYNVVEADRFDDSDLGKVYANGVYSAPTPFHVARNGVWMLTERQAAALQEHVLDLVRTAPAESRRRLLAVCAANPTKAYHLATS